jgi:Flp pilus assembly protein CpaB
LIIGVFAILLGLIAAYGVKAYLSRPAAEVAAPEPPKVEMFAVPMAVMDLPAGRTVVETDVVVMQLTAQDAARAKLPRAFMSKVPQIVGRTLKQPLKQGQPFEPSAFYPAGIAPDIADSLKPGERAVTIPFKNDAVDSTFVTPGAMVDVLFRAAPGGGIPDATVTLLSRVRVLAVGENTLAGTAPKAKEPASGQAQTVTLAVNQTQARALKVVDGRGILTVILRNAKDEGVADKGGPTTLAGLLGMQEPLRPFVSEMYRRGRLATMTFVGGLREKIKLDPPFGLPVQRKTKDGKDVPEEDLEVWPPGWWGWGGGWGGYGNQGAQGTYDAGYGGWGGSSGWGGSGGWGGWGGGYGGPN